MPLSAGQHHHSDVDSTHPVSAVSQANRSFPWQSCWDSPGVPPPCSPKSTVLHPDGHQGNNPMEILPLLLTHTRGMQDANEMRLSRSSVGFLNTSCITNTQVPYCIYFQMKFSISSYIVPYIYTSSTHLNNLIKLSLHYAAFKSQFNLASAGFSM